MSTIDTYTLFSSSRGRVYLLWALLVPFGFVLTHYNQLQKINGLWFLISVAGLGYMARVMPLRVKQMRNIFLSWFVPVSIGMIISGLIFYIDNWSSLIAYLGALWLGIMAIGYALNGLVDKPAGWYWFAAAINVIAAGLCYYADSFTRVQYLVAAIITAWSMINLWLLRSDT